MVDFDLEKILFIDIETVPLVPTYTALSADFREHWENKMRFQVSDETSAENLYEKAGIYAEFGKVICISFGNVKIENGKHSFRIKSFFGDDEKTVLLQFSALLQSHFNTANHRLCAHNGREFDFPFLCRRMLVNDVALPNILNLSGKKPWEVPHIDTLDLWKFGDYKNYTSLSLLCSLFNIPTPKDDIKGNDVARVYWEEKNIDRIALYCQKDVLALTRLFLKLNRLPGIDEEHVVFVK